jgi:acetylxylan esterase
MFAPLSLFCLCLALFSQTTLAVSGLPQNSKRIISKSDGNATACVTSGVHMIIARASTESPGPGIIGAVATMVQSSVPGSDFESVDYPATLTDYFNSEASGVAGMQKLVRNYAARCPDSKIALLGYSQVSLARILWDTS